MIELTPAQIDQFQEDGFLVVERLIDAPTVNALRAAMERLFRGEFSTGITPDEVNWQEQWGDPSLTRQICNAWKADRTVARTVLRADIARAVATLGGWRGARVMIDNILWKPAGTRPLGYHQDSAYLSWYSPPHLLSCWMALDDTSARGGTVEFVRGSHRWQQSRPEGEFHGPADYQRAMREAAAREGVEPEIVYVEVPAGGGSFHHGWTWHGSGCNEAEQPRRSVVLHAMPDDVHYDPRNLGAGTGRIYSRYKRLDDNVMDENHFPILWRQDGYRTPGLDAFLTG
ncbi:MAG: phytanoyl-CoA dioxygenase family protein [Gammaproteobacteria bacterium]